MAGLRLFLLYGILFYIFPFLLFLFFGWHKNFHALSVEGFIFGFILTFIAFFVTIFGGFTRRTIRPIFSFSIRSRGFSFFVILHAFVFLVLSIQMNKLFTISFRHSGPSLSQAGLLAQLYIVFKAICAPLVVMYLKALFNGMRLNFFVRISCFILVISLLIFQIAAFDVLFMLIFLLFSLGYSVTNKVLNISPKYIAILSFPAILATVFLGIGTKVGFQGVFDYIDSGGVGRIATYLQYRQGIYFFSSILNYASLDVVFSSWIEGVAVLFDLFKYRLNVIFGNALEQPILSNLNVLNFSKIYVDYFSDKRVGASPGLLSAFIYLAPVPICFLLLFIFVRVFSVLINSSFPKNKVPLAYFFILLICFFGVFNNPLHVYTAIGPDMVKSMLLFLALLVTIKGDRKNG